ncbi:unnamed protein product [Paramecium pentaurelia]|uniref:Protein kinase domain-containing protein n=1 Tax=Paramecium pentaurelia TaxID=43138 RepID=A0A8S1T9H6_9CILI|nr:unnamed protein product [Paramecium pentaurelia]
MYCKQSKSFFDDLKSEQKFWKKQVQSIDEKKIEFQCLLQKKNYKTGFWMSKNYVIYESQLIKIKPKSKQCHIVNLNLSRIQKVKYENKLEKEIFNKEKYGFRVIRNNQYREFYSRSKELNLQLWNQLRKEAFLSSFTEYYVLEKIIGKGNFAKVYQSLNKENQKLYAVKVFEKNKMRSSETDKQALLKEISIMRKLNYNGVIKLHEVFEDEINIYFVLDYLEGGELYHHIKNNEKFPEKLVAKIIATILKTLDYLQKQNILHRDLKPENMILRNKGILDDIVITDFGLADYYSIKGNYLFSRCGTPGYVAPEVLHDETYDFKIDIFSVGCLMYVLLAGRSPFKGQKYDDIVLKNYHCQVDYKSIENQISSEGQSLLKQLLNPNPQYRPTSRLALRHLWFEQNLNQNRFKELNYSVKDPKDLTIKSSLTNIPFQNVNEIIKPIFESRKNQQNKQEIKNQPTAQYDDTNSLKELNDSENDIVDDEDVCPQSHFLPQYQIISKFKLILDSQKSFHLNSPYIQNTTGNISIQLAEDNQKKNIKLENLQIKKIVFLLKFNFNQSQQKSFFPSLFLHNISQRNVIIQYIQDVEIVTKRLLRKSLKQTFILETFKLNSTNKYQFIKYLTGEKMMIKLIFEKIDDSKFNELLYNLRQSKIEVVIVNEFQIPLILFIQRNDQVLKQGLESFLIQVWLIMNVKEQNNQVHPQFKIKCQEKGEKKQLIYLNNPILENQFHKSIKQNEIKKL